MCESAAYLKKDEKEELLMQSVAVVLPTGKDSFVLRGLLGDSVEVKGRVNEINLMSNKIIFVPTD